MLSLESDRSQINDDLKLVKGGIDWKTLGWVKKEAVGERTEPLEPYPGFNIAYIIEKLKICRKVVALKIINLPECANKLKFNFINIY